MGSNARAKGAFLRQKPLPERVYEGSLGRSIPRSRSRRAGSPKSILVDPCASARVGSVAVPERKPLGKKGRSAARRCRDQRVKKPGRLLGAADGCGHHACVRYRPARGVLIGPGPQEQRTRAKSLFPRAFFRLRASARKKDHRGKENRRADLITATTRSRWR